MLRVHSRTEPGRSADEPADDATAWVTVSEAASRLKLTPYGIKSRIRRGALRAKQGNDRRLLVGIPADLPTVAEDEPGEGIYELHAELEPTDFTNIINKSVIHVVHEDGSGFTVRPRAA